MSTRGLDVSAVRYRLTSERPPRQNVNTRRSTLKIYSPDASLSYAHAGPSRATCQHRFTAACGPIWQWRSRSQS
jgi:hypothetical protein